MLLDGLCGVDATLEEIDRTWWMFLNIGKRGISNHDELHLYYAESPLGPWREHAGNPVKSDVRSSRPAGRLIKNRRGTAASGPGLHAALRQRHLPQPHHRAHSRPVRRGAGSPASRPIPSRARTASTP